MTNTNPMTDAVKLLTEAEWRTLFVAKSGAEIMETLRERGLIAPEPDKLAVAVGDAFDRLPSCWNRETFTASVCDTLRDHGMEMRPPLTREMVRIAYHTAQVGMENTNFIDRLHAALTKDQS